MLSGRVRLQETAKAVLDPFAGSQNRGARLLGMKLDGSMPCDHGLEEERRFPWAGRGPIPNPEHVALPVGGSWPPGGGFPPLRPYFVQKTADGQG